MYLARVRVVLEAVRYLETGTLPGFIEAYLTDASGFRWQIVDKSTMFHEYDSLESRHATFPMEASLPCEIVLDHGGPTVSIVLTGDVFDTGRPYKVDRLTLRLTDKT
jgi:hypothetical protein